MPDGTDYLSLECAPVGAEWQALAACPHLRRVSGLEATGLALSDADRVPLRPARTSMACKCWTCATTGSARAS